MATPFEVIVPGCCRCQALIPGKLTIHPPANLEKHTYKVRRGDTLTQIANRFRVTVASLMIANGLRSSALRVGQQIVAYTR